MYSGVGVGGYCLTKDPLFANASTKQILGYKYDFPLSNASVVINQKMTFNVMSEFMRNLIKRLMEKKFY